MAEALGEEDEEPEQGGGKQGKCPSHDWFKHRGHPTVVVGA